jgi:hypothetical protein
MSDNFTKILQVAEDLSNRGGILFGSVAWHIQTDHKFKEQVKEPVDEIDVNFPNAKIEKILNNGYEKINGDEFDEVKESLSYNGINDPYQSFFRRDGVIIDATTRPLNYEAEIVNFEGYRMLLATRKQLLKNYEKASKRPDISEKRRNDYKKMLYMLENHKSKNIMPLIKCQIT